MIDRDLDQLLAESLAPPAREPDTRFAERVALTLRERERFARDQKRVWIRTAIDAGSVGSVIAGLYLLSQTTALAPYASHHVTSISSPLLLVLLLWVGVNRWRTT